MYVNYAYICRFKNYELPLNRGTGGAVLVGNHAKLDHVTTTNTVHYEKFINENSFLYKFLLSPAGEEKIQSRQISLIWGEGTPHIGKR